MQASTSQTRPEIVESDPLMSVQLVSAAALPAHGVTTQASISVSTVAPVESVEIVAEPSVIPEKEVAEAAKAVAAASTRSVILKPTSTLISELETTALLFLDAEIVS